MLAYSVKQESFAIISSLLRLAFFPLGAEPTHPVVSKIIAMSEKKTEHPLFFIGHISLTESTLM